MVASGSDRRLHVQNWTRSKALCQDLLSHVSSPTEVARMSEADRLSRLYCYSLADHFLDVDDMEVAAEALPVLKPAHKQWVSF